MPEWLEKYGKPVVVDECGYEGDIHRMWGDLSPEEMVLRFWVGFTLGGFVGHGETYVNPEEVLWWSKGGQLTGESVPRIAFLREIFEQSQATGLTPIKKMDVVAGGHSNDDYFLYYFGMHQPRSRNFNLPEGSFRIEVIDTWNMAIDSVAENASGSTKVNLPGKKYMAIRIQRNK